MDTHSIDPRLDALRLAVLEGLIGGEQDGHSARKLPPKLPAPSSAPWILVERRDGRARWHLEWVRWYGRLLPGPRCGARQFGELAFDARRVLERELAPGEGDVCRSCRRLSGRDGAEHVVDARD